MTSVSKVLEELKQRTDRSRGRTLSFGEGRYTSNTHLQKWKVTGEDNIPDELLEARENADKTKLCNRSYRYRRVARGLDNIIYTCIIAKERGSSAMKELVYWRISPIVHSSRILLLSTCTCRETQ